MKTLIITISLIALLTGGCHRQMPKQESLIMTQPSTKQVPLTKQQMERKERIIEQLREVFYGDEFGMYLALENVHRKQEIK